MAGKPTKGGLMSSRIKSANVKFFPEAVLGYLGGPFFALIPNGIINVFLTQYWVNVLGLGENADMFTWMLPLFSSIFIVIGNLLVGKLMEGKPRKAGKARPLLVLSVPAIAVAIIALFMAPNPYNGQGVYNPDVLIWTLIVVAIGYNLFYAFAWPLYYTSHSAMVNLSTRNATQRSLLGTLVMAGQVGAAGVAGMAGGLLADLLGLLPTKLNVASEIVKYEVNKANAATLVAKIWPDLNTLNWTEDQFVLKLADATQEHILLLADDGSNVVDNTNIIMSYHTERNRILTTTLACPTCLNDTITHRLTHTTGIRAIATMDSNTTVDGYESKHIVTIDRITALGKANGDVNNRGDGITNADALSIQKYLLGLISALPEN